MGVLISLASGLIGGVIAWFATNYYGRNLLRFRDQRFETDKALRLSQQTPDGSARLRQLAAEIGGLRAILPTPLPWYLRTRGYDLHSAAQALIRLVELSNYMDTDSHEIASFRVQVQEALHLPSDPHDVELAQRYRRLQSPETAYNLKVI